VGSKFTEERDKGFLIIKRASTLGYEDPFLFQVILRKRKKLGGKKYFCRTHRIRSIYDNEIELVIIVFEVRKAILNMKTNTGILKRTGKLLKVFATYLDHQLINLNLNDLLNFLVTKKFCYRSTIPTTNDKNFPGVRVNCKGWMNEHLVIEKPVSFARHNHPIKTQDKPEIGVPEKEDLLIGAFARKEDLFYRKEDSDAPLSVRFLKS
jgi:hypothetical protein